MDEKADADDLVNLENVVNSHIGAGGNAHAEATDQQAGFMSATDKQKLDGIESGAQVNQNAFAKVNDVEANDPSDELTITGGTGITITTNPNSKEVIITATGTSTPGPHGSSHTEHGADPIPTATSVEGGLMSAEHVQMLESHASRHAADGADPLTLEMIGAAPASHASQHKTGGADPLTAADIGAVSLFDFMMHLSAKASDDVHGLLQLSKDVEYLNKFAYSQVILNAEESVWYDIQVPGSHDSFNGIIFAALRMSDRGVSASWAVGNAVWNTGSKYAVLLGSMGNGANNEALELRVGGNAAPMQIRFTSTAITQRNIYLQAVGTSIVTARS